jgi:beta-lactamase regulating signal transducer with metallopeptidase domain
MMMLLLDSALRSLLLGLLASALLKLVRMRDTGTETIIWTAVLLVALAMPLLSHCLPQLIVAVPYLSPAPLRPVTVLHMVGANDTSLMLVWLARHGHACLVGAYTLGLAICVSRLAVGLILTLQLYLRAVPVKADWALGRQIYTDAALKSPASLARIILLPTDYAGWSAAKRDAVLAHEEAHIARGDFFVQLAASIHCALFWFSPFAWWLRSKLSEIAETASDEAAIQRVNDRVTYAEILLDVARRAQSAPSIIAMAKGPFIQQRVERILSEAPNQILSLRIRVLVVAAMTLVALTLASARAGVALIPAAVQTGKISLVKADGKTSATSRAPGGAPNASHARGHVIISVPHVPETRGASLEPEEKISYNPRALLDPVYTRGRPFVPASTIIHGGRTFYIQSTERPVADVSAVDGGYRPAH